MKELFSKISSVATTTELTSLSVFQNDFLKMAETIWSKQLPPERYNGIINLEFALVNPNATKDEIASALVMFGEFSTTFDRT